MSLKVKVKRKRNWTLIVVIVVLVSTFLILWYLEQFRILIRFDNTQFSIEKSVYTTLNALLFSMMMNVMGIVESASFQKRVGMFIVVIIISILGMGIITFGFYIAALPVTTYILNESPVEWIIGNSLILLSLYLMSFTLEGEKT